MQGVERSPGSGSEPRVGFTVTKKVGGAVERNRIRRRLREVVRLTPDLSMKSTHDYVIVARRSVLQVRCEALAEGLRLAFRKLSGRPSHGRTSGWVQGTHANTK